MNSKNIHRCIFDTRGCARGAKYDTTKSVSISTGIKKCTCGAEKTLCQVSKMHHSYLTTPTHRENIKGVFMRKVRSLVYWPLTDHGNMAVHEAGHLVAAEHGGMKTAGAIAVSHQRWKTNYRGAASVGMGTLPPKRIDFNDLDKPATESGLLADLLTASYPTCWPGKTFEEAGIAYATMLVAGRQSELIHAGILLKNSQRLVMRDSDHLLAEVVLKRVGLNYLALGYCQQKAREILTECWDEVQRLADHLQAGAA